MNVIPIRNLGDNDWSFLEAKIEAAFRGRLRKDGTDMHTHSLDVGRRLRKEPGADDMAIFAGYCHDLLEDTDLTSEEIYDMAIATFDKLRTRLVNATQAVRLVEAVSYSEFEYSLEKKMRKAAASKRWLEHNDYRVRLIKKADIESNKATAANVSKEFEAEYLSWAQPLYEGIVASLN